MDAAFGRITKLKVLQAASLAQGGGLTLVPHGAGHLIGGVVWLLRKGAEVVLYGVHWNHKRERWVARGPRRGWVTQWLLPAAPPFTLLPSPTQAHAHPATLPPSHTNTRPHSLTHPLTHSHTHPCSPPPRHLDGTQLETLATRPALLITGAAAAQRSAPQLAVRDEGLVGTLLGVLRGGGSVLMPVDTAGRVLELLLVLDAAWAAQR